MKNKNKKLLFGIVIFLILILPILIYLARTQQFFRPRAAFGEVTVHLVPLEVSKNVGEPFLVEVHASSGTIPVSGITVSLNGSPGGIIVQEVTGATATGEAFTDLIYDKQVDPYTFTVVSRKPTAQLPSGSFKIAQLSIVSYETGTRTLGINTTQSQAVGYNGMSEDVALTVIAGTQVSYTMAGNLCRLAQCVAAGDITTTPVLRTDNKYNVTIDFTTSNTTAQVYKIYRNTGAAVPDTHPDTNVAGVITAASTASQQFVDTNNGMGFEGLTNLHYDIDGFTVCGLPAATPSPTPAV